MHYIQHEVLTIKFEVNSIKVETLCADPRGSVGVLIACLGWPLPSFLFYFYSSSSSLVHHGLLMVRPSAPSFIIIGLAHFFFLRFARASCRTNANRNEKRDADDDGGPRGNISKGAFWLHSFTPDAFIGHFLFFLFFRMRPMNRKIPFNFNTTESHRGDLSQKIRGHLIATRFFEKIFHWIFGVILIGRWWWAATGRDEWPETPRADAVPVVSSFSRWPLFAASRRQRKCWTWVSHTDSLVTLCLVQFFNFQWNFYVISLIFFF